METKNSKRKAPITKNKLNPKVRYTLANEAAPLIKSISKKQSLYLKSEEHLKSLQELIEDVDLSARPYVNKFELLNVYRKSSHQQTTKNNQASTLNSTASHAKMCGHCMQVKRFRLPCSCRKLCDFCLSHNHLRDFCVLPKCSLCCGAHFTQKCPQKMNFEFCATCHNRHKPKSPCLLTTNFKSKQSDFALESKDSEGLCIYCGTLGHINCAFQCASYLEKLRKDIHPAKCGLLGRAANNIVLEETAELSYNDYRESDESIIKASEQTIITPSGPGCLKEESLQDFENCVAVSKCGSFWEEAQTVGPVVNGKSFSRFFNNEVGKELASDDLFQNSKPRLLFGEEQMLELYSSHLKSPLDLDEAACKADKILPINQAQGKSLSCYSIKDKTPVQKEQAEPPVSNKTVHFINLDGLTENQSQSDKSIKKTHGKRFIQKSNRKILPLQNQNEDCNTLGPKRCKTKCDTEASEITGVSGWTMNESGNQVKHKSKPKAQIADPQIPRQTSQENIANSVIAIGSGIEPYIKRPRSIVDIHFFEFQDNVDKKAYYEGLLDNPTYKKVRRLLHSSNLKAQKINLKDLCHINKEEDGGLYCLYSNININVNNAQGLDFRQSSVMPSCFFQNIKKDMFSKNLHNTCLVCKTVNEQYLQRLIFDLCLAPEHCHGNNANRLGNKLGSNHPNVLKSFKVQESHKDNIETEKDSHNGLGKIYTEPPSSLEISRKNIGALARVWLYCIIKYDKYLSKTKMQKEVIDYLVETALKEPVRFWEKRRNSIIFQIQGDRNPFVDFPQLAAKIHFHQ